MKQIIKDLYRQGRKEGYKGKKLDEYVKTYKEEKTGETEVLKKRGRLKKS